MYLVPLVKNTAAAAVDHSGLFRVHESDGTPTEIVGRLEVGFLAGFGQGDRVRSDVHFVTSPEISRTTD